MNDILEQLAHQLANAAKKPNVLSYIPNSSEPGKHEDFHKSTKVGRLLKGGNRSGKSIAGAVEGICRARGSHPYQRVPEPPTRGRIVTVDIPSGIQQIIIPLLKQWIPPSELVNSSWEDSYSKQYKTLTFRNGSTIDIKTHEQELDSFGGIPLHWCWFDEEPPRAIFNECRLRLIDYNGCWFMTMTPVEGQDWINDKFLLVVNKNVDVFEVDISDNPHLSQEALQLLDEDLDEEEKQIRKHGIFVPKGGLILKEFNYDRHVIKSGPVPRNWVIYLSIDHGLNNPTAILWHAVSPNGDVVTFMEHYKAGWTVAQHVERIKEINDELRRDPFLNVGDPSMSQKNGVTGTSVLYEYRRLGIPVMQSKKDVPGRINRMNEYFRQDKWHITENCPNLIREAKGYGFKTYSSPKIADRSNKREEPNKKNDHAVDSSGYFFNFMPQLTPILEIPKKRVSLTVTNSEDFPWQVDAGLMYPDRDEYDLSFGEIY
jgi:phage terminase large subunit-like protein